MKHVLVATSAILLLALAGTAQALPTQDAVATGGPFASMEKVADTRGKAQPSARPSTAAVQADEAGTDLDAAPINPYALAAAGLMAVAFLARHRPTRD